MTRGDFAYAAIEAKARPKEAVEIPGSDGVFLTYYPVECFFWDCDAAPSFVLSFAYSTTRVVSFDYNIALLWEKRYV